MKDEIDKAVDFGGREHTSRFAGTFPHKYYTKVSPSKNPTSYFASIQLLNMNYFCLPDLLVWYPEAQFQRLYPGGRPKCKWCGTPDCVVRKGWVQNPRHCYDSPRLTALMGRFYVCSKREREKKHPYSFRGYDASVISNSHDYIKQVWKKSGFILTHRSGISFQLLNDLRSYMNQGLSVSGFRRSLLETMKTEHFMTGIMWRDYVDSFKTHPAIFCPKPKINKMEEKDFCEFDSKQYGGSIPSCGYLLQMVVIIMESNAGYKQKRMQMTDGKHLSVDHNFKLVKTIYSNKGKIFTAMYCIMNEYGQILAWWFTNGTNMGEIDNELKKLRERYDILGFDEPESVSTDRCCSERKFWIDIMKLKNKYEAIPEINSASANIGKENVVNLPREYTNWL